MSVPLRPKRLGPYDIIAKIAGGGMATIYLGRGSDPKDGDRVAAIKVIRQELSGDDRYVTMFFDEAKILSQLEHPSIIRTLDYGMADDQRYIAMELLLGRTVADVWEAARARKLLLRVDMAAWIGARVAEGLHYAHELRGEDRKPLHIIHRDVNPTNIFMTYDGRVKLFDFGLAKARGRRAKSAAGIVKGKVAYLSPEQVTQETVDRRSDIFTLGTTIWELSTMRRLFKRENDVETIKAIRVALVPDPRATNARFPDALWKILKRSLARDPKERYATAAELASDLDGFVPEDSKRKMPALVGAILDNLFEGERERQSGWLRKTSALSPNPTRGTMAPPGPIAAAPRSTKPPPG